MGVFPSLPGVKYLQQAPLLAAPARRGQERGAASLCASGQSSGGGTFVPFSKRPDTHFMAGVKRCLLSLLSQGQRHSSVCAVAEGGGQEEHVTQTDGYTASPGYYRNKLGKSQAKQLLSLW